MFYYEATRIGYAGVFTFNITTLPKTLALISTTIITYLKQYFWITKEINMYYFEGISFLFAKTTFNIK